MKKTHKATLDNKATRQPDAHLGHYYAVTITRYTDEDGKQARLTDKTFHLKDLPALLQALNKIEGQHAALA